MAILFSDEYSGFSKKVIIKYIVSQDEGAVACATENIYKNIQNFYQENKLKLIEDEIKNKNCLVLEKGEELDAYEGICDVVDRNQVKMFKSKKVFLQKIYVPCFAVEMKKIVEDSQSDLGKKGFQARFVKRTNPRKT